MDDEEEGEEREEAEDRKEEVEKQEKEEGKGKDEEEEAPKSTPANTATDKILAAANLKVGLLLVSFFMSMSFSLSGAFVTELFVFCVCTMATETLENV